MSSITSQQTRNVSTYLLNPRDMDVLAQSDGFKILRDHLAETYSTDLCSNHKPKYLENLAGLVIVRDVLHALLVPVVELFDKAVTLASYATRATKVEDLEYAFSGQACSAFLWLQCFLSSEKEREWCYTRGCPACVVEHSLHSEFSVRMLYTACLLSDVHYPFTLEGPKLPSFVFFLKSLERALAADPLYGSEFYQYMEPKAMATRDGIEDLIHQCMELESALSRPPSPPDSGTESASAPSSADSSPVLSPLGAKSSADRPGKLLKRGRARSREMSLRIEEDQWMDEMFKRCWDQLQPANHGDLVSTGSDNLDAALKTKTAVTVTPIPSAG